MPNVIVTVEYGKGERKDLGLPMDVSCRVLAAALAKALRLETEFEEGYTLVESAGAGGKRLPANATLADAGVLNGWVLGLVSERLKEARAVPQGGAFLTAPDGKRIPLNGAYTLIGRRDPKHNILPDLDLTAMDTAKIASRRHAVIEFDQKNYVLSDQRSANGTWLNGEKLVPETITVLQEGDEIVLGRNGVRLTFQRGG